MRARGAALPKLTRIDRKLLALRNGGESPIDAVRALCPLFSSVRALPYSNGAVTLELHPFRLYIADCNFSSTKTVFELTQMEPWTSYRWTKSSRNPKLVAHDAMSYAVLAGGDSLDAAIKAYRAFRALQTAHDKRMAKLWKKVNGQ